MGWKPDEGRESFRSGTRTHEGSGRESEDVPNDIRSESGDIPEDDPAETAELTRPPAIHAGYGRTRAAARHGGLNDTARKVRISHRLEKRRMDQRDAHATFSIYPPNAGVARLTGKSDTSR